MRLGGVCRSCTIALSAALIRGSWAFGQDDLFGARDLEEVERRNPSSHEAQKKIEEEWVSEVVMVTPVVIISEPKITEPPSLIRRKLGSYHWDLIHERIQGQKRDAAVCPSDYQSCPQSLSGGCCPSDRICGASSCYPNTSASPASACGRASYVACGIEDGGGCCPPNYMCGTAGCTPSAGVSYSETCGIGSYLCPASLGYGCCNSGMACAINSCYSTGSTTFTLVETFTTTDSNSNPHTITTTIVSATVLGAPTSAATVNEGIVGKISALPSAIAKTAVSSTPSSGLTSGDIGGIIGGALAILLILIGATILILRRLNKVVKVTEARSRSSSSKPHSSRSRPLPASIYPQDIDSLSIDPLMMTPSDVSSGFPRRDSHISHISGNTSVYEVEGNSPPVFHSPFTPHSPRSLTFATYPRGYNPVANSESPYSHSSVLGFRNPSIDSTPSTQQKSDSGYFDYTPRPEHRASQDSVALSMFTRRPSQHGRNWSNSSEHSAVSQGSSSPPTELDAGVDGDRRSSIQRAFQGIGVGVSRMVSKRRSDTAPLTGGSGRTDWPASPRHGLGHIPEAGESKINVGGVTSGMSNAQFREISLMDREMPVVQQAVEMRVQKVAIVKDKGKDRGVQ